MAGNTTHKAEKQVGQQVQLRNKGQLWLGSSEDVKIEIGNLSQKLRDIKEKHRSFNDHENLDAASTLLSEVNEDLLLYCKTNRKKYTFEDKTTKADKQKLEYERMIRQFQNREQKLQKDLNEAIKAKENALNRLSEIQSRLLKHNNPEITDLSDENRPTNLGAKFKQLYEDEWTDAFEFLTDKRKESLKDETAIKTLYTMLKKCNEVCVEALKEQHMSLAHVVCDPTYLQFQKEQTLHGLAQSRPQMSVSPNVVKLDVKAHSINQMNQGTKPAQFAQTLPSRGSSGTDRDKMTVHGSQMGQDKNQGQPTTVNKNQSPRALKPAGAPNSPRDQMTSIAPITPGATKSDGTPSTAAGKPVLSQKPSQNLPDVYDAGAKPTKPANIDPKLQMPIREFSKMVAIEVLTNVKISDILPAIKKDREFPEDILQNGDIQKYLDKCFHLCWLMQVQYPPMQMDLQTKPGAVFDANVFETYSRRGKKIAFIVWPPVYLHKDGPVVCKGYADCEK